jgi:hypothetical protein
MRTSNFLNSNNIPAGIQSGFRKKLSTNKALISIAEEILSVLNYKMHVGGVSCDLTKAFDHVNHDLLM